MAISVSLSPINALQVILLLAVALHKLSAINKDSFSIIIQTLKIIQLGLTDAFNLARPV